MMATLCQPLSVFATSGTTITVESAGDIAGATVVLDVMVENNPGISAAVITFTYDEGLEALNVTNGEAFSCLSMTTSKTLESPFKVTWDGETVEDEDVKDGVIASIEFKIPDNAVAGTIYNVSATCTDKGISDNNLNPVSVNIVNGSIEVKDFTYGDLNSDRTVDNIDTTLLRRHITGGYEQTIKEEAADVDINNEVNATDTVLVRRFIAGGYGVTFPYIQNGCNHSLEAIPAKDATEEAEGNKAYWRCKVCGSLFLDAQGETATTEAEIIIGKLPKSQYNIQYVYGMEPQNIEHLKTEDTYKPTQTKVLETPILDKYKFLGWSDKNGKMYGIEIPEGTTGDLVLYANWASERNKAVPVKKLGEPIICEDSDSGLILFVYEIGEVQNVPIFEKYNILSANGLITKGTRKEQTTIEKGNAETIGKSIANTTTNSTTWTLSKDWNETTSVSEEWAEQQEMTTTEAEEFCKSNSNTYNMTNSSGGSSSIIKNDNSSYRITAGQAHEDSTYNEEQKYAKFNIDGKLSNSTTASVGVNAGIEVPLGVAKGSVGVEAGLSNTTAWEIGAGYEQSKFTKDVKTGTDSWSNNIDIANSKSTTINSAKTWNSSEGFATSQQTSSSTAVSKAVSELISKKHSNDSSYTTGGSEGESQEYASSNANEDSYSSSVTYSEEEIVSSEITIETTPNVHGSYRIVHVGTAKVFAIVGYDIKNKAYFTYTHSVLDDDEYKEYLDYSYDNSFSDYETSVLPFEIPIFVNDYVNSRITTSKLQVDDNGIVQKYIGSADDEIIFIPSYYTKTNGTTGEAEMIKITGIAPGLFKDNTNIIGVTLGNFVNEIPESAFEGCTSLKEVVCPNVVSIGANAFKGCTSLSEFTLPNEIETVGDGAFDGIPAIKSKAPTKEIANSVANSNVQNITLDISNIEADDFSDMSFDIGEIETFKLLGGYKEYKGLNINSDAQTTIISGVTISDCDVVPLEVSSPNLTLERVTLNSEGFALVLKADETALSIEGKSNILSESANGIIAKTINLSQISDETYSEIQTNANVLVCGTVNENAGYIAEDKIVTITEEEYINYLTSRKVTFDVNGGVLGTETTYKMVPYNGLMGELPEPRRDFHTFEGWYLTPQEVDGEFDETLLEEKVTSETTMTSLTDMTLYAHWQLGDVSAWVLKSEMPADAQVVDTEYRYTLTEYTTSGSSSMSGWEHYDTTWAWGPWGSWSGWSTTQYYDSDSRDAESTGRSRWVDTSHYEARWRYYHNCKTYDTDIWTYSKSGYNYHEISLPYEMSIQRYGGGNSPQYGDYDCPTGGSKYWFHGGYSTDNGVYYWEEWVSSGYTETWTEWRYRDRSKVYTYYFRRNLSKTQDTYPSGDNISNIEEWVQYRAK